MTIICRHLLETINKVLSIANHAQMCHAENPMLITITFCKSESKRINKAPQTRIDSGI